MISSGLLFPENAPWYSGCKLPSFAFARIKEKVIAKKFKLDLNRIILGSGSDQIFELVCKAFLEKGDEVIVPKYSFIIYRIYSKMNGAKIIYSKEDNFKISVKEILKKVTRKTKIVFLANPNNPTGTYIDKKQLISLRRKLRSNILLVVDDAYYEYVKSKDYSSGLNLFSNFKNVVITRTFSKIYGLAALRIGWAYASLEVIDYLNRIRLPFNINTIAQHAAIAAIQDKDFIEKAIEHNNVWKPFIEKELINLGLSIVPGVGNFVLTKFDNSDEANNCYNYLEKHNIFVRKVSEYGLADCLRITIGLEEENIFLIKIINDFMKNN